MLAGYPAISRSAPTPAPGAPAIAPEHPNYLDPWIPSRRRLSLRPVTAKDRAPSEPDPLNQQSPQPDSPTSRPPQPDSSTPRSPQPDPARILSRVEARDGAGMTVRRLDRADETGRTGHRAADTRPPSVRADETGRAGQSEWSSATPEPC